jgi:hypothetical protein
MNRFFNRTVRQVILTAPAIEGGELAIVEFGDAGIGTGRGYGIARDGTPILGMYWTEREMDQCVAAFEGLAELHFIYSAEPGPAAC